MIDLSTSCGRWNGSQPQPHSLDRAGPYVGTYNLQAGFSSVGKPHFRLI